jgi:hypothetical protein
MQVLLVQPVTESGIIIITGTQQTITLNGVLTLYYPQYDPKLGSVPIKLKLEIARNSFYLLKDGLPVIDDLGRAVLVAKHHVSPLGPQGHPYQLRHQVHSSLQTIVTRKDFRSRTDK